MGCDESGPPEKLIEYSLLVLLMVREGRRACAMADIYLILIDYSLVAIINEPMIDS